MTERPPADLLAADGAAIEVLRGWQQAREQGQRCVLAVVCDVAGSAYVAAGTLLLFGGEGRLRGWLSGGCLEREVEVRAAALLEGGEGGAWIEIDQREATALLAPSASGCRGRIRVLLLGPGSLDLLAPTLLVAAQGAHDLHLHLAQDTLRAGCADSECVLPWGDWGWPWAEPMPAMLRIARPPRLLLLGAGAEAPVLLPLLRSLGWRVEAVEQRRHWLDLLRGADRVIEAGPEAGLDALAPCAEDPVLIMHHEFERDRAALAALADLPSRWIGLLGPASRRNDLFKVLPAAAVTALQPRLESPVGLDLGGKGPAAIALSIAASLQRWRHAR